MKPKYNDELYTKRLCKLRENKGWTQEQAAEAIGTARGTWQEWERGVRYPSGTALTSLSFIFNVSIDYLRGATDEMLPSVMCIPQSRLQDGDWDTIEAYLDLTPEEKQFIRITMNFLKEHRKSK